MYSNIKSNAFIILDNDLKIIYSNRKFDNDRFNRLVRRVINRFKLNRKSKYIYNNYFININNIITNNKILYILEIGYLKNNDKIIKNFYKDNLSGLCNRNFWEDFKKGKTKINKEMFNSIILIDIDNLKSINDTYGHSIGDECIKQIAYVINTLKNKTDIGIRYGGDEFIIISTLSRKKETYFIKRFKEELGRFSNVPIEVSIGISYFDESKNIENIFKIADMRMYKEKKHKNVQRHLCIYSEIKEIIIRLNQLNQCKYPNINNEIINIISKLESISNLYLNPIKDIFKSNK
ncbi:GGDEF domain-containing protein [Caldicellulosiruptoraceae bacterium PP1]